MKPLKQNKLSNKILSILTFMFIIIFCITSIFFISCNKDLTRESEKNSESEKPKIASVLIHKIEIVVHKGSSIQAAVAAAVSGTIIKIEPGIYNEAVIVNKSHITLIGINDDENGGVIIQNPGNEKNGITVTENSNDFILKNVTVRNFKENGVYLSGISGFLLSHITTINNGEYGLFPVHCKNGIIEECVATGHTDTGIYVGQSTNIEVNENESYANVNGIEIENSASIVANKNHCYNNTAGMLVVLLPGLQVKECLNNVITKNKINNNNHINFSIPGSGFESAVPSGSGLLIVGADNTIVKNNDISDNHFTGIALVSTVILGQLVGLPPEAFADIEPNPDGTRIKGNKVVNNGTVPPIGLPLPGVDLLWDGSGKDNCWVNNSYFTTYPLPLPTCNSKKEGDFNESKD